MSELCKYDKIGYCTNAFIDDTMCTGSSCTEFEPADDYNPHDYQHRYTATCRVPTVLEIKPEPIGNFEHATANTIINLYRHAISKHKYYKNEFGEDSFDISVRIMGELFPSQAKKADYKRFVECWEIVRKLCVIANGGSRKDGDTSMWSDVVGWAIRSMVDDELREKKQTVRPR